MTETQRTPAELLAAVREVAERPYKREGTLDDSLLHRAVAEAALLPLLEAVVADQALEAHLNLCTDCDMHVACAEGETLAQEATMARPIALRAVDSALGADGG